ncbi:hypothetical protein T265_10398 [Opisthorchis viverrini]|uniref:Chromatin-remodeling ATPase INO80 n=1 Tax=Opisthorchis viverrini TaxID=6198 RepID=A0A074Z2P7_OPIVI|nr:hypothetical protein T265_10398 [Opisthorchis viverrini]KER21238.1 hypothetical protein T265_10398 [Opisthorchis viverrini]
MELIKEIEELDMLVRAPSTVLFADADSVQQLSRMYWEEQWSRYPELRPLQTVKQPQQRSGSFRSTFASPAIAREIGQMVAEWRAEAREKVSRMTDTERFQILADLGIPGYAELAGRDAPCAAAVQGSQPSDSMNSPIRISPKQSTHHPPSSTTARKRKSSLLLRGARFTKQSRLSGYSRFQRKASKRRSLKTVEPVRPSPDEQKAASQLVEDEKYDDEEDLYADEEEEEEDQLTVIVRRQREVFSARVAAGRPSIRNTRPPSTAANTTTATTEYKLSGASSAALARAMLSNKVLREWKALARKVVCKVARQWIATRRDKMSLAKRAARDCARLMRQRALVSQKSTRDAVSRAQRLAREISANWHSSIVSVSNGNGPLTVNGVQMPSSTQLLRYAEHYSSSKTDNGTASETPFVESATAARRRAERAAAEQGRADLGLLDERAAAEQRRADLELLEARRQQRKLNFLITQTELYAHFMARKLDRTAVAAAATGMQGSENSDVKASRSSSVDEQEDDDAQQILQRLDEADEYELDENSQQSADDVQAEKQPQSTESSKTLVSNSIAVAARAAAQRLGISPEEEEYGRAAAQRLGISPEEEEYGTFHPLSVAENQSSDLMSSALQMYTCIAISRVSYRLKNEAVWCSTFSCLKTSQTRDSAWFQHQKLRWLGHVLRMPNHRLPKRVLFSVRNAEWRKQRGGQPMTWQRSMKEITKRLGAVGATRLPGWGPRDPHCAWLETLQDMAANRCQWRSCCQFLSRLPELSNKSWLYGSEALVLSTDRGMKEIAKRLGAAVLLAFQDGDRRIIVAPDWRRCKIWLSTYRAHFQQLHPAACSDSKVDANAPEVHVEAPSLFQGSLKGYQLRGLTWLLGLFDQGINGILADEMGLGKTIQAIAFLGHLAEKYNIWGPFLVVAPASTLHNWTQEFAKFLPSFRLVPYWGSPAERKVLRRFWFSARPQTAPTDFDDSPAPLADEAVRALPGTRDAEMHVVITSYQIVLQDAKFINKTPWAYIVLDEAHAIKSTASLRWRILLSFKCRNRLLLTGTPIQNTMQELWALLHFIMPTLFDSHDEFANWFSRDIESQVTATSAGGNGSGGASSTMSLATSRFTENQLSRLHLILKPFMLRRTKAEVEHEISTKTEITLNCPLSQRQQLLYERLRNKIRLEDLSTVIGANGFAEIGPNSTALEGAGSSSTAHLINLVMQLRKVCNHPDLWERRESRFSCITGAVQPSESEFASCFGPHDAGAPSWTFPRLLYDEGLIPNLSWSLPGGPTSISLHPDQPRSDPLDFTVSTIFHPAYVHQDLWHHDDLEPDLGPAGSDIRRTGGHQRTESPDKCFSFIRLMDLSPSELSTAVVTRGLSLWLDSRWRSTTGANALGHTSLPTSFDRSSRIHSFIYDQMVPYLSLWYLISYSHLFVPRYKPSGWGCFSYFAADEPDFTAPSIATDFLKPMCIPKVVLQPTHLHVRVPWFCERETRLSFPQRVRQSVSNTFTVPDFFISCQRMFPLTVKPVPVATRVSDSGKLVTLDALLNRLKPEGHRVLIYSQMTRMIDILEDFMIYRKHAYLRLDGSSRLCDRRDMVAQWQSSSRWFVFLLSTRAGGLGINLTAADTVIFYDSDWNPTVDQQAMDRAHRLGQTKPVTVYRLVCQNTIEGRMMQRAEEKRAMQQMVIHSGQDNGARSLLPAKQSTDQLTSSDMVSLLLDDDELVKRLQLRRQQQAQRCRPARNPAAARILVGSMASTSSTTSFPTATAVESGGDPVAQNSTPSYIQESQLERKRSAVNLDQGPQLKPLAQKPNRKAAGFVWECKRIAIFFTEHVAIHVPTLNKKGRETVFVRAQPMVQPGMILCECRADISQYSSMGRRHTTVRSSLFVTAQWLGCQLTDHKVRGSDPASASPLILSRLRQLSSIRTFVLPSGSMAASHRRDGVSRLKVHYCLETSQTTDSAWFQTHWFQLLPFRSLENGRVGIRSGLGGDEMFSKYTNLQINLVFARDSNESLVHDNLQLNVLHTGRLMIQLARYSRYRSISS